MANGPPPQTIHLHSLLRPPAQHLGGGNCAWPTLCPRLDALLDQACETWLLTFGLVRHSRPPAWPPEGPPRRC
eukprot:2603055-Pyramimonas_sp.AAC.1